MQKQVLMAATVPSMIGQFNMDNIRILLDMGYKIDVACDFNDTSVWPKDKVEKFRKKLDEMGIRSIQIDFSRSPINIVRHIKSITQVKKLLSDNDYSFIHTHTPIASAIIRFVSRKKRSRIIYTAHGFHFYKGAPKKNWIIFYPLEKYLSRDTDVLITINHEDYERSLAKFHAKKNIYVPGIGVDTKKFRTAGDRNKIRKELGIDNNDIMLLSVGELNDNKNHQIVIKALEQLPDNIYYVIVGKGYLEETLRNIAEQLDVIDRVKLVGYRDDVIDFYSAADVFVFPSYREGLSVALMEAMASSLPVICSRIRGNTDLIDERKGGFLIDPASATEITHRIEELLKTNLKEIGMYNQEKVSLFDVEVVTKKMVSIYNNILED
ncbi:MAG: glycosyltransferase family 4 protein [Parasporobacterium sp.]|nr:glycosyltransferase family 4 protein [Parasporobacterium sp.]